MGVDFGTLVSPVPVGWSALAGKKLAVDGNNTLYQFLSSVRQADGTPLMDSKGRITGHLAGCFYRTVKWLEYGIKPIFIFDGKPPLLKEKTLTQRRERKEIAKAEWGRALQEGRTEDAHKFAQATSSLNREMTGQAATLLEKMGVPVVIAPSEGGAQAACMPRAGLAWAAASQDYDSLLFGSPRLLRNLSTSGRRKVPRQDEYVDVEPETIELESVLSSSGLTHPQLIWLAILMGTDFNGGVKGVGPKKGLKLVQGASSWKEIIARLSLSNLPSEGIENAEEIEEFFVHPPAEKNPKLAFAEPDTAAVSDYLCGEFDFSRERVERTLFALAKKMKETGAQTKLGDW